MKATKFLAGIIAGLMTIGSVPCYRQNISDSYLTAIAVEKDPDILYGDVNQDGEITVADSVIIQNYDLYPEDNYFTEQETILADVNFDGEVNILDAARISAYLLGNSEFELASDEKDENWDSSNTLRLMPTETNIRAEAGETVTVSYYIDGDFDLDLIQGISGQIMISHDDYYNNYDINYRNSNVTVNSRTGKFNKVMIPDSLDNYIYFGGVPLISIDIDIPYDVYDDSILIGMEDLVAGNINGQTVNSVADSVEIEVHEEYVTTMPKPEIYLQSPDKADLYLGNTFAMKYSERYSAGISWSSSDKNVASVDSSGNVTINGYGEVTILATARNYSGMNDTTASVTFKVSPPEETTTATTTATTATTTTTTTNTTIITTFPQAYIYLQSPDEADLYLGNTFKIKYSSDGYHRILWSSSNESVASVDESGNVTINGYGDVIIHATTSDQYSSSSVTFKVSPPAEAGLAGDASGDNKLDIADVVILASYVGNPEENPLTPEGLINGDVHNTGDGITSGDVLAIQQYLAQIIKELPV